MYIWVLMYIFSNICLFHSRVCPGTETTTVQAVTISGCGSVVSPSLRKLEPTKEPPKIPESPAYKTANRSKTYTLQTPGPKPSKKSNGKP